MGKGGLELHCQTLRPSQMMNLTVLPLPPVVFGNLPSDKSTAYLILKPIYLNCCRCFQTSSLYLVRQLNNSSKPLVTMAITMIKQQTLCNYLLKGENMLHSKVRLIPNLSTTAPKRRFDEELTLPTLKASTTGVATTLISRWFQTPSYNNSTIRKVVRAGFLLTGTAFSGESDPFPALTNFKLESTACKR